MSNHSLMFEKESIFIREVITNDLCFLYSTAAYSKQSLDHTHLTMSHAADLICVAKNCLLNVTLNYTAACVTETRIALVSSDQTI